jgi:uncharacterized protein YukE
MSLLAADPHGLRAIADRIARHAETVRATAARLRAAAQHGHWHGVAASAFQLQLRHVLRCVLAAAAGLDDAAAALRRLAEAVEQFLAALRRLARDPPRGARDTAVLAADLVRHPGRVLGDAGSLLSDAAGVAGDVMADLAGVIGL